MKKNQKGFSVVEILGIVVVVGLLAAVGWYVYSQKPKQNAADTQSQTAPAENATTDVTNQQTADPNAGYLVVKEWGLRFKVPNGLTDVKYTVHGDKVAFFAKPSGSNVQYRADYDKSTADGYSQYATGNLIRSTSSTKSVMADETREGKKVGDYYYYTSWAFSSLATGAGCTGLYGDGESYCSPEGTAFQLVNQGDTGLLNTIELAQ